MKENFFIDDEYIEELLETSKRVTDDEINKILDKSETFEGLKHDEVAALLQTTKPEHIDRIFKIADKIKKHIYGERVVMFAPLYVSDYCVNRCEYCGFNHCNDFERRKLSMEEIRSEVKLLEKMGHKRIALEAGEDPVNCPIDYILDCIKTIYAMKFEHGEIRRINVNIAATTVENYKKLKDIEIGTYILFQETYKKSVYENVHPSGPKHDYMYHTTAFDRAMEAGIEDVGGGILCGLYNYKYEVLGLMLHNEHLEDTFNVGFHTVSVPRIRDAAGFDTNKLNYVINDEEFLKMVAIIRLAIPFTGLIISTRESAEMRKKLISIGVSQMSGGSSVEVGGYTMQEENSSQFKVADERCTKDIAYWIMSEGLVPSFCTACYRKGRTGDRFMSLAKSGNIKNVCLPNALLTLKEYSLDYGDEEFVSLSKKLIENKLNDIEDDKVRQLVVNNLGLMEKGQRDLYL